MIMFTLKIKTGNAAFDDGEKGRWEVIRILKTVIEKLENGYDESIIMDYYGNKAGEWKLR